MKSGLPLILSVLFLAAGLGVIIGYCHGSANFNAAYPFAGSMLHIDMSTSGPGVLGGLLCTAIGVLLLLWAFITAVVGQIARWIGSNDDRPTERLLE